MSKCWRLIGIFGILCCAGVLGAQIAAWDWALRSGDADYDIGEDIALDALGNQYVTGYFSGTASFGSTNLTSAGGQDMFLAKLDKDGNFIWALRAGGTGDDLGYAVSLDGAGNILFAGTFESSASIGSAILISHGQDDIFVAKYSSGGSWIWTRQAGGTSTDFVDDIDTDTSGNAYLTGYFQGTASFGTTSLTSAGQADLFAAKLSSSGSWSWAVRGGGTGTDRGKGIAVDGSVYLAGEFYEDAVFGSTSLEGRVHDILAAKLDSNGNWLWAKKAGSAGLDWSFDIALDASGNAYLTGFFEGTAGFGSLALISSGSEDIFVAKINSSGTWQWARKAGGPGLDEGFAIAIDGSGRISVAGFFHGTAAFGGTSLTSAGDEDIFAGRMSSNGVWQWAKRAGGVDTDWGLGIAVDQKSYMHLTGCFRQTADFGPYTLNGAGVYERPDIFVARITALPLQPTNLSVAVSGYDDLQLNWDDVTLDTFYNNITGVRYILHFLNDPYSPDYDIYDGNGDITSSEIWFDGGGSFSKRFFRVVAVIDD